MVREVITQVYLAENAPYLTIAFGAAVIAATLMIATWLILYRLFPGKIANPYPNLLFGEDPHAKKRR